jgi:hypothetical protein
MSGSLDSSDFEADLEGARGATGETASATRPDPEVFGIGRRRQFSGSEKRLLLAEAARWNGAGTLEAFLGRKHIYSSMFSSWRKRLGSADHVALAPE